MRYFEGLFSIFDGGFEKCADFIFVEEIHLLAVEEECWRAVYTCVNTFGVVFVDGVFNGVRCEILGEFGWVEADLSGIKAEGGLRWLFFKSGPGLLVGKKDLFHFPEFTLKAGGFSGFSGELGVFVKGAKWEVAINEFNMIAEFANDFVYQWFTRGASGALEIAVFDNDDFGFGVADSPVVGS